MTSPYCTQNTILLQITAADLIRYADLDGDGVADSDVVLRACEAASAAMDGYISPQYTVPLTGDTPDLLRDLAGRWAVYLLQLGRQSVTEDVRKQHEDDVRFLERVGSGDASLGDPVNMPGGDAGRTPAITSDTRRFTREKLEGW